MSEAGAADAPKGSGSRELDMARARATVLADQLATAEKQLEACRAELLECRAARDAALGQVVELTRLQVPVHAPPKTRKVALTDIHYKPLSGMLPTRIYKRDEVIPDDVAAQLTLGVQYAMG